MTVTIDKPLESYTRRELFAFAEQLGIETQQRDNKPVLIQKIQAETAAASEPPLDPTTLSGPVAHDVDSAPLASYEAPSRVVRPSDVERLISERLKRENPHATDAELAQKLSLVDRFRFIRDEGLPAPLRRYRVTCRRHTGGTTRVMDPFELDAVDESAAKSAAMDAAGVMNKERHHWLATVVLLQE